MGTKHSPGPWREEYGDIYDPEGRVVCRKHWSVDDNDPQWRADARLITAAPELLAIVEVFAVVNMYADPSTHPPAEMQALAAARALIRRIEGE